MSKHNRGITQCRRYWPSCHIPTARSLSSRSTLWPAIQDQFKGFLSVWGFVPDAGIDVLYSVVGKRDAQSYEAMKTGQTLWLSLPAPRLLLMLYRSLLPLKTWSSPKFINVYVLLFVVAHSDELKTATGHVSRSIWRGYLWYPCDFCPFEFSITFNKLHKHIHHFK